MCKAYIMRCLPKKPRPNIIKTLGTVTVNKSGHNCSLLCIYTLAIQYYKMVIMEAFYCNQLWSPYSYRYAIRIIIMATQSCVSIIYKNLLRIWLTLPIHKYINTLNKPPFIPVLQNTSSYSYMVSICDICKRFYTCTSYFNS